MRVTDAPAKADHVVFGNDDLATLLREVSVFVENLRYDSAVWELCADKNDRDDGGFSWYVHIYLNPQEIFEFLKTKEKSK